ncbi:hypothetical protein CLV92_101488 [Kineococcus xinjiangensis]|uniref:Uncharacterized protein n=1 Tax=Kineococcus xinjiangensis TaxID=512762 RepID=A0A2S6IWQ3_9ACTN|nr:hypothetical protein [Kineococcus xinjiangensis]PPK98787.1 hypothetical protein CLV92_101488 [Kineococcus xinjiangensis]
MNDLERRLRTAFAAQEDLAPDADSVLAGVEAAVARHRRRRRAVRAGGAAVAAGATAAFLLTADGEGFGWDRTAVQQQTASGDPARSAASEQEAARAFSDAGYTYDDAVHLSGLWQTAQPWDAKVEGGHKLLEGRTLPITPGTAPSAQSPDEQALNAYVGAGYDWDDAAALALHWGLDDPSDAKVRAGRLLLDGGTVPVEPGSAPPAAEGSPGPGDPGDGAVADPANQRAWEAYERAGYDYTDAHHLAALWVGEVAPRTGELLSDVKAVAGDELLAGNRLPVESGRPADALDLPAGALERFLDEGYTSGDAAELAQRWGIGDTASAKAVAGLKLAAGTGLPFPAGSFEAPASEPAPDAAGEQALDAYFGAGYGYDQAVELSQLWKVEDILEVKITAGKKLLAGERLPVQPTRG